MKLAALGLLLALSACDCGTHPLPPPPAPIPVGADSCEYAWRRLEQLSCPDAASPKGVTFATTCRDEAALGIDLHPACVALVARCEDVPSASRGQGCK